MNITPMVTQQVFIMLVLIMLGFALTKYKIVTQAGAKDMSALLLNIVIPCVLVQAYQADCDAGIIKEIIFAFLLSIVLHVLYILLSTLVFKLEKDNEKRKVNIFTSVYSNCGFMGIPLLSATLGAKGVILGSAYLAVFTIFSWTHGLYLYGEDRKLISVKKLCKNPGIIGVAVALILFFANIKITGTAKTVIGYVASLNTPLSMILLGTYLGRGSMKSTLKSVGMYTSLSLRLLILPLVTVLLFKILSVDEFIGTSLILSAACPSAAVGAIFAERFNMDACYPSQLVSVSTIISIVTLPLMSYIITLVL